MKVNNIFIEWLNNTPTLNRALECLSGLAVSAKICKNKRCTCLKCSSACGCKSLCDNAIEVDATNVIQDSDDDSEFE